MSKTREDLVREVAAKAGFPNIDEDHIIPNLIRTCIGAGIDAGRLAEREDVVGWLRTLADPERFDAAMCARGPFPQSAAVHGLANCVSGGLHLKPPVKP